MCYVYLITDIAFIEHIVVHYIIIKYQFLQNKNNAYQQLYLNTVTSV